MKRYFLGVSVVAMLCMPSLGQTVFMEAVPGPTVDLTDPLNPTVDAGNPISIDIFLDGSVVTVPQVVGADVAVTLTDKSGSNPGTLDCVSFDVDEKRGDFLLNSCSLCAAVCGDGVETLPSVGLVDFSPPWADIDFVAHVATITFLTTNDADGDWEVNYDQDEATSVIGGPGGSIINVIDNPGSFVGLTVTVLPACTVPNFAEPEFGVSFSDRAWDGYIDARRESSNGTDIDQGLDTITIEFTTEMQNIDGSDINATAFSLVDTAGTPPAILSAASSNGGKTVTLELDGLLTLQEWSTVIVTARSVCDSQNFRGRFDIGILPCDLNQDGLCNPLDVTRFRQYINGILDPNIGVETDYTDINRNGERNPLDLTALRQLVFGTGNATKVWNGEVLPAQP